MLSAYFGMSLDELAFNVKVEGYSFILYSAVPGLMVLKFSKGNITKVRLRHYTNNKGLKGIKNDMKIIPNDKNRIYSIKAKGKPLSSADFEQLYGVRKGRGRNYVEYDVDIDRVTYKKNSKTGQYEYIIKGDVELDTETTIFYKR